MKTEKEKTWESKREFKESVYLLAEKLNVDVKQITMRTMTHKWASFSTKGNFTFNVELLGFVKPVGEYVILHEMMHAHIPNHGKLWKSLMMTYMPDYERRANLLKQYSLMRIE